jgi:hypothetical protein
MRIFDCQNRGKDQHFFAAKEPKGVTAASLISTTLLSWRIVGGRGGGTGGIPPHRYLAVFGGIWRYLAVFGGIWRYLAVFYCDSTASKPQRRLLGGKHDPMVCVPTVADRN